jgi:hypothetical protein
MTRVWMVLVVAVLVGCGEDKPAVPVVDKNAPVPKLEAASSGGTAAKKGGPAGTMD